MNAIGLQESQEKMRLAGVPDSAINVFSHYYEQLAAGATGLIPEDSITPLVDPPVLAEVTVDEEAARDALARTVLIKLNGGLGTSMGMDRAKSLLPVRDGRTFLDLIVEQVRHARAAHGVALPLILMNSFRTRADSVAALRDAHDVQVPGLPLDFLQNQEPKLLVSDLTPVSWPADPTLEWCPPGHGDIYTALLTSGVLEKLLDQGFKYASTSNSDNLGAVPNPTLAGWFAASGAPFAAEVCRRTPADRKGGHLAVRTSDGRIILRESAQTDPADMDYFTDENRHLYFNTNNLWFDLEKLQEVLTQREGVLGLPLIRNQKTVDPADPSSPEVYQIETAMGAAIEVFAGAQAIVVDRTRFLPVKTTDDLLLLRSDAYDLTADGTLELAAPESPHVRLDPRFYRTVSDFDARFPFGAPSLRAANTLTVQGDWTFEGNVTVLGDATLPDSGSAQRVAEGTRLGS